MQRRIIHSDHHDVWRHLATEEQLLEDLPDNTCILYIWSSADAVVIGKNQNPWLECHLAAMESGDCRLARRLSGGGAVFHDSGNLNFSFILSQADYDKNALTQLVLQAIRSLQIQAAADDRHVLHVKGRKFSGNAFCHRRQKVIHHGTLLVSADLEKLRRYLQPTCCGIETRGIRSVPAEVMNLTEERPALTVAQTADALAAVFGGTDGRSLLCSSRINALAELQASPEWRFLRTPRFRVINDQAGFAAVIDKGRVTACDPANHQAAAEWLGQTFPEFLRCFPNMVIQ